MDLPISLQDITYAENYLAQGDLATATPLLERLVELAEEYIDAECKTEEKRQYFSFDSKFERLAYRRVEKDPRELVQVEVPFDRLYSDMAFAYIRQQDYVSARNALMQAVRWDPMNCNYRLDLAKRTFDAAGKLVQGNVGGAINVLSPLAIRNLTQAYDMANTGAYRDTTGKTVIQTTPGEAVSKAIGFQPQTVKLAQESTGEVQRAIALNKLREGEIADQWAQGIFEKDQAKVDNAKAALKDWNTSNPESKIRIEYPQLAKRLASMKMTKAQRIEKTAPKEIKATIRKELETP